MTLFSDVYKKSIENERKELEKMVCPKCSARMVEHGAITIKKETGEVRHCAKCYGDWLEKNIPVYAVPSV